MRLQSLRSKLLLAVFLLVIGSGVAISFLVTRQYGQSLLDAAADQAEHLAHALALESTDKVLTNDLVSLQKFLDYQRKTHPSIAYLFLIRDKEVLSHTFSNGLPVELITANSPLTNTDGNIKRIESTNGDRYVDIAWPVLSGKAGILRLGLSEKPYRQQVFHLAIQMMALTLGILLIALAVSYFFIRRVTKPLGLLAGAVEKVGQGNLDICVEMDNVDEVGTLAASFQKMISRVKDHTCRLEQKTLELDRAYRQTHSSLTIIQKIGAQATLRDVASYLLEKFEEIVACRQMLVLIFNENQKVLGAFVRQNSTIDKIELTEFDATSLTGLSEITFKKKRAFDIRVCEHFPSADRMTVFPIRHEDQPLGTLLMGCPVDCRCDTKALEVIDLILKQTAGVIKRAALYEAEIRGLQGRIEASMEFSGIVGKDPKMQTVYKLIEDIAPTDATVLIQGETGTGKELVARAIHEESLRAGKPFVVINCSAYPATLLEGELFGHEKGAFTGAIRQKPGRFEQADGGTIFLDEIADVPTSAQIKLLRVVQTQKFERLGGERTLSVDVRVISASNKDLIGEVKEGRFREDLFYRLNVIPVHLPALNTRRNDIPLLARHFLKRFSSEQGKDLKGFSTESMRLLMDHAWPGNVRELENTIEHAAVLAKGDQVEVVELPSAIRTHIALTPPAENDSGGHTTIMENEVRLLREVLATCGWNKKEAARRLGISRSTLYDKLKKYQITPTLH
jgi:DNA-binding NtrC family response regulator/HAMP domain-containing protein